MSLMPFARTVLHNLVRKPVTRAYPAQVRPPFAFTRGQIAIDIDACIFCGLCMRKCPTHAIQTDRPGHNWQINRLRCIQCSACVGVCPKQCLTMQPEYTKPSVGQVVDHFHVDNLPAPPVKSAKPADPVKPVMPAANPVDPVNPVRPADNSHA